MDLSRKEARHRRGTALGGAVVWLALCLAAAAALPARAEVLRLTQSAGADQHPGINRSGQVVWEGSDGKHTQIYLWDGTAVRQLTSGDQDSHSPQINDAGQVAWSSDPGGIYLWDGAAARRIADQSDPQPELQLNQAGQIAWVGDVAYVRQVFLWDGAAVRQLSSDPHGVITPRLSNRGQVVWMGSVIGVGLPGGWYIYLWDGESTRLLSQDSRDNGTPQINDAGQVVWQGVTADYSKQQLYLWDGTSIRPLFTLTPDHAPAPPQINQAGQIVWADFAEGVWTLYRWDQGEIRTLKRGQNPPVDLQINNAGRSVWREADGAPPLWVVYSWDGAALQEIERSDALALPSFSLGSPSQNDAGQVVWTAGGEIYRYTPPAAGSLAIDPTPVVGGDASTGRVTLTAPAPAGGTVVTLSSSDAAVVVPPRVTVPAGATTASFPVTTRPVPEDRGVTLTAATGGATWTAVLRVWSFTVDSLHLGTDSTPEGEMVYGMVRFHGVAPAAGAVATLASDHPEIAAPAAATVTVSAGGDHADLLVQTHPVAMATRVTLSVQYNGVTRSATLMVTPPVLAGITLSPTRVRGRVSPGGSTDLYVSMESTVRRSQLAVALSTDRPDLVQMPGSMMVSPGYDQASIPIQVEPVLKPTVVQITASYGGISRTAALQVDPVTMDHLTLKPDMVSGGVTASGELVFVGEPPAGTPVSLSTERPDVIVVPAKYVAPPGLSVWEIPIATRPVAATTRARVFVSFNGQKLGAWLTLLPYALSSFTLVRTANPDGTLAVLALDRPAPAGGATIYVQQVGAYQTVRADTITVPAGSVAVTAPLGLVTRDPHQIQARLGGAWVEAHWEWSPLDATFSGNVFSQPWIAGGRSLTGTLTLFEPAPDGGATFPISSLDPSVLRAPASVTVPAGERSAKIPVQTFPVKADTVAGITISPVYGGALWVLPPGLVSVSFDSVRVTGGQPVVGTITLTDPAPAGGTVVKLVSADPALTPDSGSVVVPAGATSVSFPVSTTAIATTRPAALIAIADGRLRVGALTLLAPALTMVTVSPPQVQGGAPATGAVVLSGPAPAEGLVFDLQTDSVAYCVLPEQVVVPPGATTATFPVLTDPVDQPTPVHISARRGPEIKEGTLTLLPP